MMKKACSILLVILLLGAVLLASACDGSSAMAKDGDTVKVHYTGTLEDGSVFDSSVGKDPLEFTLGGGTMISGFEQAVYGMNVGQYKTVTIPTEEAYGLHDDDLVIDLGREQLPAGLDPEIGQSLQMQTTSGQTITVSIIAVSDSTVTVDANHPLAGKDLTFEIELVEIN